MDDFNISSITESKNEWCARLTNILTPCLIEGIKSIFEEADNLCTDNDQEEKYLMTFQNLLNNIPKWSSQIIETEKERIITSSGCNYLEDLLTCVHITQVKALTISRVGIKQKKLNIDIPNFNTFLHKAYINIARKIYINVYLFQKDLLPLEIQKNNRELEIIIKEALLNTIRENIPIEDILKIYLDETQETDVEIEETKEIVPDIEEIKKSELKEKEKTVESLKEEIKETMKKEQSKSVEKAIMNANKSLNENTENTENTENSENNENNEISEFSNKNNSKSNIENLLSENINNKLDDESDNDNISIQDDLINNHELDIKTLDEDIDQLNLDILDLNDNKSNKDDSIDEFDLGIQEL